MLAMPLKFTHRRVKNGGTSDVTELNIDTPSHQASHVPMERHKRNEQCDVNTTWHTLEEEVFGQRNLRVFFCSSSASLAFLPTTNPASSATHTHGSWPLQNFVVRSPSSTTLFSSAQCTTELASRTYDDQAEWGCKFAGAPKAVMPFLVRYLYIYIGFLKVSAE